MRIAATRPEIQTPGLDPVLLSPSPADDTGAAWRSFPSDHGPERRGLVLYGTRDGRGRLVAPPATGVRFSFFPAWPADGRVMLTASGTPVGGVWDFGPAAGPPHLLMP